MPLTQKLLLSLAVFILTTIPMARTAAAHPMGNFSINHYAKIIPGAETVELDYIIDLAEIPTFQETEANGLVPKVGDKSVIAYLVREDDRFKNGLSLAAGGRALLRSTCLAPKLSSAWRRWSANNEDGICLSSPSTTSNWLNAAGASLSRR